PNYQLYGPTRFLDTAINVLHNTGTMDLRGGYHARTLRYLANLTMPDRRFDGLRIIPGMGNSGDRVESIFGQTMRAAGPDMHGFLRWMHRENYGPNNGVASRRENTTHNAFNYLAWKEGTDPGLKSRILPNYGVMFRDRAGTPHETSMLFRAGMNWSHWDTDVFNVIVYGQGGMPVSPGTGYGYLRQPANANNAIYHNRVKLVKHDAKEIFGRVDNPVQKYGFGEYTDYAMGERYYPPELYEDGKERRWRRHVLFMKSPTPEGHSYFVMRDTFPGNPSSDRSWWTWLNLGEADNIQVNGSAFDPESTPHNKVPNLKELAEKKGNRVRMKIPGGGVTHFWFAGNEPLRFRARITFTVNMHFRHAHNPSLNQRDFSDLITGKKETKTVFEAMAPRGEDYFYTVYPRSDGGKAPDFQKLEDGVIKVDQKGSTEYAFISDTPIDFNQENVVFTARAGAVRIFDDRVVLTIKSGSGRVGYKGHVYEGKAPFERTIDLDQLEKKDHEVEGGAGRWVKKKIADQVTIRGELPFEATVEDETSKIETRGRKRALLVTRPTYIRRPEYTIDGEEWMATWTDWPDSGGGKWKNTKMIGLSVPEGEHTLVIRDMTFPKGWRRSFEPRLENVER
ncbi:MAG: hypothetical protein KGZ25_03620, partial [Planctomycetes bacterium]|nr:hypothetical protein [Planctomycetota bacterium]